MGAIKVGRSKFDREGKNFGIGWSEIVDNGYTSICGHCFNRTKSSKDLVGKERLLVIEDCDPCRESPRYKTRFERYNGASGFARGY
jgi:hypothetical protein